MNGCAALAAALLLVFAPPPGRAQSLPPEITDKIDAALAQGRAHQAARDERMDRRWRGIDHRLAAAVVDTIAVRPDLVGPIMVHAAGSAPESRGYLVSHVSERFPAFSNTIRASAGGAVARPLSRSNEAASRAIPAATSFAGVPPPEQRPANWPVLPREGGADGYDDPLEGVNRVIFYANGALDVVFFEPLAQVYRAVMPEPVRRPVGRAFTNLAEPVVAANHLLQRGYGRTATSLGRFLVNSVFGLAGLFDVATELGLEADDADFGQTLHGYGVGDGPYLVLPFFGPSTARDAVGFGVDGLLDPRSYLLDPVLRLSLALGEGVVRREEVIDPVDFLVDHADDRYEAVRAWTYQKRQRALTGGCTEPVSVVCPDGERR